MIRKYSPRSEVDFIRSLSNGDFEPVEITVADYERMAELADTYIDRPMGVTDASVIAIAERLGIVEIACTGSHRLPHGASAPCRGVHAPARRHRLARP